MCSFLFCLKKIKSKKKCVINNNIKSFMEDTNYISNYNVQKNIYHKNINICKYPSCHDIFTNTKNNELLTNWTIKHH